MHYKLILFLVANTFCCLLGGMEGSSTTLLLPVNHTVPNERKVTLAVVAPASFRSVSLPNASVQEFIPKIDNDPYKWSQQITTQIYKDKQTSARDVVQIFKKTFCEKLKGQVLDATGSETPDYCLKKLAMVYEFKNRRELLLVQYVSGPADCAGMQYALPLSSELDASQALAKAEEFMNKHVKLLIGPDPSNEID